VDDFKLIVGNPGDNRIVAWPEPAKIPVAFGLTGGKTEAGTSNCRHVETACSRRAADFVLQ
jgi:hypothetical protein